MSLKTIDSGDISSQVQSRWMETPAIKHLSCKNLLHLPYFTNILKKCSQTVPHTHIHTLVSDLTVQHREQCQLQEQDGCEAGEAHLGAAAWGTVKRLPSNRLLYPCCQLHCSRLWRQSNNKNQPPESSGHRAATAQRRRPHPSQVTHLGLVLPGVHVPHTISCARTDTRVRHSAPSGSMRQMCWPDVRWSVCVRERPQPANPRGVVVKLPHLSASCKSSSSNFDQLLTSRFHRTVGHRWSLFI